MALELTTLPNVKKESKPSQVALTQIEGKERELIEPSPTRAQVVRARVQLFTLSWSVRFFSLLIIVT